MDIFTYLMVKKGHNLSYNNDLISYLIAKDKTGTYTTKEGLEIIVNNSLIATIKDWEFSGNSSQFSTTGKNKLDFDTLFGAASILTKNADGSYTVTGDGTSKGATVDVNIPAGDYYLSVDYVAKNNVTTSGDGNLLAMNIFYDDNTSSWGTLILSTSVVGTRLSFKISETNKAIKKIYLGQFSRFTGGTVTFKNVQIGTDAVYEPFTNGIPAPNPDYPYPVKTVTGENSLIIQNENLFDIADGTYTAQGARMTFKDGVATVSFTASSSLGVNVPLAKPIKLKANQPYTRKNFTNGAYPYITLKDENNDNIDAMTYSDNGVKTYTPTEDIYVYSLYFWFSIKEYGEIKPMLVKGSTAPSEYVPHEEQNYQLSLGNIELCKVGDYQDYIYGSSDVSYNLFDSANPNTYLNANGVLQDKDGASSTGYIKASEGEIYTIWSEIRSNGVVIASYDENYNLLLRSAITGTEITHTCPANTKYIMASNYLGMSTNTLLIKGSEVKPYFPYGQVGMWCKREYIGKLVIDETQNILKNSSDASNCLYYINLTSHKAGGAVISDKLTVKTLAQINGGNGIDYVGIGVLNNNKSIYFNIGHYLETNTVAGAKSYLANNNILVCYPLDTPQYIPITDTTLINQLNNIYNNAHSYNGVTNITSTYENGNEQMYLKLKIKTMN